MVICRFISLLVHMLLVALVASRPAETVTNSNATTVARDNIFALTPNSTVVGRVPRPRGFYCEAHFINDYGLPQIKGWMAILQAMSEQGLKDYTGSIETSQTYKHPSWPGALIRVAPTPGRSLPRSFLMSALEGTLSFLMGLNVYCYEIRVFIYNTEEKACLGGLEILIDNVPDNTAASALRSNETAAQHLTISSLSASSSKPANNAIYANDTTAGTTDILTVRTNPADVRIDRIIYPKQPSISAKGIFLCFAEVLHYSALPGSTIQSHSFGTLNFKGSDDSHNVLLTVTNHRYWSSVEPFFDPPAIFTTIMRTASSTLMDMQLPSGMLPHPDGSFDTFSVETKALGYSLGKMFAQRRS